MEAIEILSKRQDNLEATVGRIPEIIKTMVDDIIKAQAAQHVKTTNKLDKLIEQMNKDKLTARDIYAVKSIEHDVSRNKEKITQIETTFSVFKWLVGVISLSTLFDILKEFFQ